VIAASGLLAEAQIAARSASVKAVVSGGEATHLADLIEAAITEGGRGILSFGIAGGLGEDLPSGTCLIGSEVVHAGKLYRADPAWTAHLAQRLTISRLERLQHRSHRQATHRQRQGGGNTQPARPAVHRLAGVDRVLSMPCDKRALGAATGAAAVDMESHIVADLAARHGLPFAVLRVIADPVGRAIPRAALLATRPDGTINAGACWRSLVREPGQVPALLWVAVDASRAMLQLARCVRRLGPGLGFFERG
jgi:adenosylhomocysteine nucleosidase